MKFRAFDWSLNNSFSYSTAEKVKEAIIDIFVSYFFYVKNKQERICIFLEFGSD
jgi:hypothetical protein